MKQIPSSFPEVFGVLPASNRVFFFSSVFHSLSATELDILFARSREF